MEFFDFLIRVNESLEQSYWFRSVKFALGLYIIVMVLVIFLALYRIGRVYWTVLIYGQEVPKVKKGSLQKKWDDTIAMLETEDGNKWKAAIINASEMLNEVLSTVGYKGGTLGERLESISDIQLANINDVREANKIKNLVVQDESFVISREESGRVVEAFGDALRFFEAID